MVRASGWKPEGRWFNSNFKQMFLVILIILLFTFNLYLYINIDLVNFYLLSIFIYIFFLKLFTNKYLINYNLNDFSLFFFFKKNFIFYFLIFLKNCFNTKYFDIFYNSFFKWSPIFKKTSYFGLYTFFRK